MVAEIFLINALVNKISKNKTHLSANLATKKGLRYLIYREEKMSELLTIKFLKTAEPYGVALISFRIYLIDWEEIIEDTTNYYKSHNLSISADVLEKPLFSLVHFILELYNHLLDENISTHPLNETEKIIEQMKQIESKFYFFNNQGQVTQAKDPNTFWDNMSILGKLIKKLYEELMLILVNSTI